MNVLNRLKANRKMATKSKWYFLSYELNDDLSAYRNGQRIVVTMPRSMKVGDECNETHVDVGLHYGTHIDFPFHFLKHGFTVSDYDPDFFITEKVALAFIDNLETKGLVSLSDIKPAVDGIPADTECLILHTGMSVNRFEEKYWSDGIGLNTGVAEYLRLMLPNLRQRDTQPQAAWPGGPQGIVQLRHPSHRGHVPEDA